MYGGASTASTDGWAGWTVRYSSWSGTDVGIHHPSNLSFAIAPEPRDPFGRTEREARRDFSRAKAVPPISIPGNPEDRIAPLEQRYTAPEQPRPTLLWLSGRRGAPRQKTCSRSRRRLRTWERDLSPTP